MRLAFLFLFLASIDSTHSYKILVYSPRFSQSINNFLGNIADTLVDAGHDVTTLIPIIIAELRDGTHKSKKIHIQPSEETTNIANSFKYEDGDFINDNDLNIIHSVMFGKFFTGLLNSGCATVLDEPGLVKKLVNEKFDVMILENFESCGTALSHIIKPKALITTAGAIPMGHQGMDFGLDSAMSYNPSPLIAELDVHSFSSRLLNMYANFVYFVAFYAGKAEINTLFRERYGPEFPGVHEIGSHAAFNFINTEPLIDFAAPTLSRIVSIGGIGAKAPKKLDGDLDRILSLRKKTVLISLGSIVQSFTLPLQIKQNIVKVISQFPEVTFIWKYEQPEDAFAKEVSTTTPNLHLFKWMPQNDILADGRLTAFITHGGMASTQETALRGKPGIYIPFFGDQFRNAGMMQKNGLGTVFDKHNLYDANKLHAAVKNLLENESYYENAARVAAMIAKKPFSSKELLVKTVEFAAEFGPSPALRPQSYDMSWIEYHNADIIVAFAVVSLIIVVSALKIVKCVLKKVLRIAKVKEE